MQVLDNFCLSLNVGFYLCYSLYILEIGGKTHLLYSQFLNMHQTLEIIDQICIPLYKHDAVIAKYVQKFIKF